MSQVEAFIEKTRSLPNSSICLESWRDKIRAAVIEECMEKSFRHASMAGIAKRAQVSTASLYREFVDRQSLLEEVANFTAPLIFRDFMRDVETSEPRIRLQTLLVRHGKVFDNPHANWLYRAHVSGEVLEGHGLVPFGKDARNRIEAFWAKELRVLGRIADESPSEIRAIVNLVLGAVQRRSLLAMLLFGLDDQAQPILQTAVAGALDWVIALYGETSQRRDQGKINLTNLVTTTQHTSDVAHQIADDLARPIERSDIAGRHQKILAAAVQECSDMGFAHVNMAAIACRAGVSTATLYDHFADKEDILAKAAAYVVPILASSMAKVPDTNDPRERIAQLLITHGEAFLDPFMTSLYRLFVSFDGQSDSVIVQLGRNGRALMEQFWSNQLTVLENQGYLVPSDHPTTINLLLGCVERPTLISFLLYGFEEANRKDLFEAAVFAAEALFKRLGTQKFTTEFGKPV
jgi:AcrR family transcriptional regulator